MGAKICKFRLDFGLLVGSWIVATARGFGCLRRLIAVFGCTKIGAHGLAAGVLLSLFEGIKFDYEDKFKRIKFNILPSNLARLQAVNLTVALKLRYS